MGVVGIGEMGVGIGVGLGGNEKLEEGCNDSVI